MTTNSDSPYHPLMNSRRESHIRANSFARSLFVLAVLIALAAFSISDIYAESEFVASLNCHDEHTIPTPLLVVDPETDRYLYSLNVPLYDKFRKALRNDANSLLRRRPSTNLLNKNPAIRLTLDKRANIIISVKAGKKH